MDETLIHAYSGPAHKSDFKIVLNIDEIYNVAIRPGAAEALKCTQELFGYENVVLLTAARRDYAEKICELAGFDFTFKFCRGEYECGSAVNFGNFLIDNLPYRYNTTKTKSAGIAPESYLHVRDYYGQEEKDRYLLETVKDFFENVKQS